MSASHSAPAPNADPEELRKFDALAACFWDAHGAFRPLHVLNPVRSQFIASPHRLGLRGYWMSAVAAGCSPKRWRAPGHA